MKYNGGLANYSIERVYVYNLVASNLVFVDSLMFHIIGGRSLFWKFFEVVYV
jgi:hypothetical protein